MPVEGPMQSKHFLSSFWAVCWAEQTSQGQSAGPAIQGQASVAGEDPTSEGTTHGFSEMCFFWAFVMAALYLHLCCERGSGLLKEAPALRGCSMCFPSFCDLSLGFVSKTTRVLPISSTDWGTTFIEHTFTPKLSVFNLSFIKQKYKQFLLSSLTQTKSYLNPRVCLLSKLL